MSELERFGQLDWEADAPAPPHRPYCHVHCAEYNDGSVHHVPGCTNRPRAQYLFRRHDPLPARMLQRGAHLDPWRQNPRLAMPLGTQCDLALGFLAQMTKLTDHERKILAHIIERVRGNGYNETSVGTRDYRDLGMRPANVRRILQRLTTPVDTGGKSQARYRLQPIVQCRTRPRSRHGKTRAERHPQLRYWYFVSDLRGKVMMEIDDGIEHRRHQRTP